jgi:hypothetical protein
MNFFDAKNCPKAIFIFSCFSGGMRHGYVTNKYPSAKKRENQGSSERSTKRLELRKR